MSEPESMVWHGPDCPLQPDGKCAEIIVAWVNANGGEAHYESGMVQALRPIRMHEPRIAVRTAGGWQYAKPGDRIVKGAREFLAGPLVRHAADRAHRGRCGMSAFLFGVALGIGLAIVAVLLLPERHR